MGRHGGPAGVDSSPEAGCSRLASLSCLEVEKLANLIPFCAGPAWAPSCEVAGSQRATEEDKQAPVPRHLICLCVTFAVVPWPKQTTCPRPGSGREGNSQGCGYAEEETNWGSFLPQSAPGVACSQCAPSVPVREHRASVGCSFKEL